MTCFEVFLFCFGGGRSERSGEEQKLSFFFLSFEKEKVKNREPPFSFSLSPPLSKKKSETHRCVLLLLCQVVVVVGGRGLFLIKK